MEIHRKLIPVGTKTSVALGYFDGMHRGHEEIMRQTVEFAKRMHLHATVFTFDFSAARPGEKGKQDLFSRDFIYSRMEKLGVDLIVEIPFNEIRNMSGRDFIYKVLGHGCLNAAVINCGEDFRFGKGRNSDTVAMKRLAGPHGIQVNVVPFVLDDGIISTTRIKQLISVGDIPAAEQLLGYRYFIESPVIKKDTGVGMNFSSVSQLLDETYTLPKFGVYISRSLLKNSNWQDSVTYIGTRPSRNGEAVYADTNIFSLNGAQYREKFLHIELLRMIRAEEKFESLSDLKDAISNDIKRAKMYTER